MSDFASLARKIKPGGRKTALFNSPPMKRYSIPILMMILFLSACSAAASPDPDSQPTDWWQEAVFYEIFVRSFYDSNCDGIGDFNGITQNLDYLESLGVNALWLMPIHPATNYHGYDVTDYMAVNPDFGTIEDFKELVDQAHQRGIRVIIDLVINHTSIEHPWFQDAVSNPNSPYRDWYLWSETYPGYNGPMGTAWHGSPTGYYYGVFWSGMPDLNQTNPEVIAMTEEISRFWLNEIGVDGFRIDAAKHLIEEGEHQENTESTHAWFREYHKFYKGQNPQAYTVGEVFGAGAFFAKTYTGDQFDQVFNFDLAYGFINSALNGTKQAAVSAINFTLKDLPDGNYATFLTNHDQNRVIEVLGGDMNKARVAASLLLTAPGTPYIYYGEEIGMRGKKPDEDIRRPMQWTDGPNAGFSCPEAIPWRPPYEDHTQVNAAAQQGMDGSLLTHYQTLIALRKAHPALQTGSTTLVSTDHNAVYAVLRSRPDEQVLVIINLSGDTIDNYLLEAAASPLARRNYDLNALLGSLVGKLKVDNAGGFSLAVDSALAPFETLILELD